MRRFTIKTHVTEAHQNKKYELNGYWDSRSKNMLLWFPIKDISLKQDLSFETEERTKTVARRLGIFTVSPSLSLETSHDLPYKAEESMPEIEKSAKQLAGEGLVIVTALFYSQKGRAAMERCGSIIEDIYAKQMIPRLEG